MTQRSDLARYTSFPGEPGQLAARLGEFARDANNALEGRVLGRVKIVRLYAATGSTASKITLTSLNVPPYGAIMFRAEQADDPAAVVAATNTPGFSFERNTVNVFEPGGLTANVYYNLTFLILEA